MIEAPSAPKLRLFEGFGIEIEYGIVDAESLSVLPVADRLLERLAGGPASDASLGTIGCSNELVLHVVELKTEQPEPTLEGLSRAFDEALRRIAHTLESLGARLMPTAMHPLMDPATETHLWPHDGNEIYSTFDRVFGCSGHGWANLQSLHLNLPFGDDAEFGRLHAAIRLVLPLLPALAASSPLVEGHLTGLLDNRMDFYLKNSARIPSVGGHIVPEPVFGREDYEREILRRIARDVAPHDPEGVLDAEWTNSRGAIARFVRDSIEVRVVDSQECPAADLAIAAAAAAAIRAGVEERWMSGVEQRAFATEPLAALLRAGIREGGRAVVSDERLLRCFGILGSRASMAEIWAHLVEQLIPRTSEFRAPLDVIVRRGCLADRIRERLGPGPSPARARISELYRELCDCLVTGRLLD